MDKECILTLLKRLSKSYLQCFITVNIFIFIVGAILSNNTWWLLFTTFKLWVSVGIILFLLEFVCMLIKKLRKQ